MIKYDSYKSSGIEWLGEIPSHWNEIPIKAITEVKSIKNKPNEELLSVYRDYGVILKSSRDDNHNKAGQDLSSYKFVEKTNLVLNKMKTWQGSLGVSQYQGIVSPAYIVCRIDIKKVFPKYLNHLLRSNNYIFEYNRLSYGVRTDQWDMRYSDFKNTPLFLPPKNEQEAIANFLDKKLEQVDNYISKQKELIKLLKEKKSSLINQAVTKGLNPKVEYKESGIEWLGKIPKHWELKRLKHIAKLFGRIGFRGYTTQDLVSENEGAITISPSNIKENNMDFSKSTFLSWKKYYESPEIQVKKNDLLMVKTGSSYGKVGYITELLKEATINPQLVLMTNIKVFSKYLFYLLKSDNILFQINNTVIGGTIPTVSQYKIENFLLFIAPKQEQQQIVEYIEKESSKIDKVISTKEDEIKLLDEYKQSLISSAVTGEIKVS